MKLQALLGLLAASLAGVVHAQERSLLDYAERLPACGLTCLVEQLPLSACQTLFNTTCVCSDPDLYAATQSCVQKTCKTAAEAIDVSRIEAEACQRPSRNRQNELFIPLAIEVPAFLFFLLRMVVKGFVVRKFEVEDWIMLAAGLIYTAFLILGQYIGQLAFGLDLWTVTLEDLMFALKLFYFDETLYLVILALTKLSILYFFLRIFPSHKFRMLTYAVMAFVTVSSTIIVFMQIFQCVPIKAVWEGWKGHFGNARCLQINTLAYTAAGMSIVQDLIILVMPLPVLYKLKMSMRSKLGIMFMFSLGIFILITSCIRLRYIVMFARSANPTWDYTDAIIWSGLEAAVSVIVACLPAFKLLVSRMLPGFFDSVAARTGFSTSRGAKKTAGGTATHNSSIALQSGKFSEVKTPDAGSEFSPRLLVPRSKFSLFDLRDSREPNESELELGDRMRGEVQTEIGVMGTAERAHVNDGYGGRRSSSESGIHVQTTMTVVEGRS